MDSEMRREGEGAGGEQAEPVDQRREPILSQEVRGPIIPSAEEAGGAPKIGGDDIYIGGQKSAEADPSQTPSESLKDALRREKRRLKHPGPRGRPRSVCKVTSNLGRPEDVKSERLGRKNNLDRIPLDKNGKPSWRASRSGRIYGESLNPKQRKLINLIAKYPEKQIDEIGVMAGYKPHCGYGALHRPKVSSIVQRMMEEHPELQRWKLLDKLADGLKAHRDIVVGSGSGAKLVRSPDQSTRHKFLETAFKLNGDLVRQDESVDPSQDKINLAVIIMQERERRGLTEPIDAEVITEKKVDDATCS